MYETRRQKTTMLRFSLTMCTEPSANNRPHEPGWKLYSPPKAWLTQLMKQTGAPLVGAAANPENVDP